MVLVVPFSASILHHLVLPSGASGGGRGRTDHGGAELKRDGQKKGWSGDRGRRRGSQDGNPFGDKGGYQHDTFRS